MDNSIDRTVGHLRNGKCIHVVHTGMVRKTLFMGYLTTEQLRWLQVYWVMQNSLAYLLAYLLGEAAHDKRTAHSN